MNTAQTLTRKKAIEWAAAHGYRLPFTQAHPHDNFLGGREHRSESWKHPPSTVGPAVFCHDILSFMPKWQTLLICPACGVWPAGNKEDMSIPQWLGTDLRTTLMGRVPAKSCIVLRGGSSALAAWILATLTLGCNGQSDDLFLFSDVGECCLIYGHHDCATLKCKRRKIANAFNRRMKADGYEFVDWTGKSKKEA